MNMTASAEMAGGGGGGGGKKRRTITKRIVPTLSFHAANDYI